MKVSAIKTEKRIDVTDWKSYGIQTYGLYNDYPQKLLEITATSGTVSSCLKMYEKFVRGDGFNDEAFSKSVINKMTGLTADRFLKFIVQDLARFNGFAVHINYNILGQKTDVSWIPFEFIRLGLPDDSGYIGKLLLHNDWGRRRTDRRWSKDDIKTVDIFNSNEDIAFSQILEAGTIDKYSGQIYYFSGDGYMTYPKPIYDPVITDISSEDGIATVRYRNIKYNFLPAGILIRKTGMTEIALNADGTAKDGELDSFSEDFKKFQGADEACKIVDIEVSFDEEKPEFVPFEIQNLDKLHELSETRSQNNIGGVFMQPPVLRGELISGKLGTSSEITDAYNFYNSITTGERADIDMVMQEIFTNYSYPVNTTNDFSIKKLQYLNDGNQNVNI